MRHHHPVHDCVVHLRPHLVQGAGEQRGGCWGGWAACMNGYLHAGGPSAEPQHAGWRRSSTGPSWHANPQGSLCPGVTSAPRFPPPTICRCATWMWATRRRRSPRPPCVVSAAAAVPILCSAESASRCALPCPLPACEAPLHGLLPSLSRGAPSDRRQPPSVPSSLPLQVSWMRRTAHSATRVGPSRATPSSRRCRWISNSWWPRAGSHTLVAAWGPTPSAPSLSPRTPALPTSALTDPTGAGRCLRLVAGQPPAARRARPAPVPKPNSSQQFYRSLEFLLSIFAIGPAPLSPLSLVLPNHFSSLERAIGDATSPPNSQRHDRRRRLPFMPIPISQIPLPTPTPAAARYPSTPALTPDAPGTAPALPTCAAADPKVMLPPSLSAQDALSSLAIRSLSAICLL